MTLYSFATLEPSPAPKETLATLAHALDGRRLPASRRVMAGENSRSPDEGLALLEAYVGIADKDTRQAILDMVGAIANADPYRRSRSETTAGAPIAPKPDDRQA